MYLRLHSVSCCEHTNRWQMFTIRANYRRVPTYIVCMLRSNWGRWCCQVLFPCSGCCLPADVGLRSRLGFKCGRWHCADIQSPIPSASWTVSVCLCVCVNEWGITLDIYINQFIKSLDVQQSNVHNWHVQSLSASSGDMISFHHARVLQGYTYWTLRIMLTAGDVKALDGLCHMLSGSAF